MQPSKGLSNVSSMIRNISYNNKEVFQEINRLVGRPFAFRQRLKLGGTGSQRLLIRKASSKITDLLKLDTNLDYCNIELRTGGIVLRFRSILETYAWAVPYDRLTINRSAASFALSDGEFYVELEAAYNTSVNMDFFNKMVGMKKKAEQQNRSISN